jgi:hypothetical protein
MPSYRITAGQVCEVSYCLLSSFCIALTDFSRVVTFLELVWYNGDVVLNKVSSVRVAISLRHRYLGNACLHVHVCFHRHSRDLNHRTEQIPFQARTRWLACTASLFHRCVGRSEE